MAVRKKDVLISTDISGQISYKFQNKSVTGIAKLAQKFIVLLFTDYASKVAEITEGTTLVNSLLIDGSSDETAFNFFTVSTEEILRKMRADNNVENPDFPDEQIADAKVLEVTRDSLGVTASISITSVAGNEVTVQSPSTRI